MATYNLAKTFLVLGAIPFLLLGLLHIVLIILDIKKPGALSPDDKHVRIAMHYTRLRISSQTTMWKAWTGLNLSHGAAVIIFGLWTMLMSLFYFDAFLYYVFLPPLVLFAGLYYLWLAIKYWFKFPAILVGLGAGCFGTAYIIILTMPVNMPINQI